VPALGLNSIAGVANAGVPAQINNARIIVTNLFILSPLYFYVLEFLTVLFLCCGPPAATPIVFSVRWF